VAERTATADRLEEAVDQLVTSLSVDDDGQLLLGDEAADTALDHARASLDLYSTAAPAEHTDTADVLADALAALLAWPRLADDERPEFKVALYALEMARYQYGGESRRSAFADAGPADGYRARRPRG
jgi:hypothetical protein